MEPRVDPPEGEDPVSVDVEDDGDREYDDLRTTPIAEAKQFGPLRWHRWCVVNNYYKDQK